MGLAICESCLTQFVAPIIVRKSSFISTGSGIWTLGLYLGNLSFVRNVLIVDKKIGWLRWERK